VPDVLDAFDAIARARPDAVAIVARDATWTFAELARESERCAEALRAERVRDGDVVALSLGRTASHVVAMLASWRAGAAFLAIDGAAPPDRVRAMLEESRARVILSTGRDGIRLDRLDRDFAPLGGPGDDLAYVVYTSGSSGKPKGVRVSHRGLVPMLHAQIRAFGLGPSRRSLLHLSTAFDASISDIGTALLSGATLIMAEDPPPPLRLVDWMRANAITHADLPPAILPLIDPASLPPSLETVIVGGDVCPPSVIRAWARRVRVVNVYGPTEATICTSLCACDPNSWERPLVGDPLEHVEYAVDDGELLIAGPALALGYIDRPDLESQRFVVRGGVRWYRTGDRVKRQEDGQLEFLGRLDRQIKLRGQLVCPEEIESCLRSLEGVRDAAVIEERLETSEGAARRALTALVVEIDGARLSPTGIRERLAESLPRWMLPRVALVGSIARGASGKVDHAALVSGRGVSAIIDPRTRAVAQAFEEVLGVEGIGEDDDVIDLGGDSLAALEIAMVAQLSGVAIQAPTVLAKRTPRAIAGAPGLRPRTVAELDAIADRLASDVGVGREGHGTRGEEWLVTGATGFLGRRLLPELLARTSTRVHCLVRAASDEDARARLGAIASNPRVAVHASDVSAAHMAMPLDRWRDLTRTVGTVVHAAASLSLALPYEELEIANVRGAIEIARFVREGGRKALHHVSSLAVLASTDVPDATLDERTALGADTELFGAYAQTKWVAEALLRRVIPDVTVIRPGLLTGDSATGVGAPSCPLFAFLRAVAMLGCAPLADEESLRVDVTPIDHAARAIADVATSPTRSPVVHIASENGASLGDLVRAMREHKTIDAVPRETFLSVACARLSRDAALALVASAYRLLGADAQRDADLFLHTGRRFPCTVLESIVGRALPPVDGALLSRYAAYARGVAT
jgi:amino acid adenylation domain-containing protein/thioester reductase-like protein